MRKPETMNGVRLIPARSPAKVHPAFARSREERPLEYLARQGKVTVEPVEGGYRVTSAAGSVCGHTLEDALIGAVRKEMES